MSRVSSNDAVFDMEKLNWINFQYMKKLSEEELLDFVLPFLEKAGYVTQPLSAEKETGFVRWCATCATAFPMGHRHRNR